MRREGDKILFDSEGHRIQFEGMVSIGDEEFQMQLLRLMYRAVEDKRRAWKQVKDDLGDQLKPGETLAYDHAERTMYVAKTTTAPNQEKS